MAAWRNTLDKRGQLKDRLKDHTQQQQEHQQIKGEKHLNIYRKSEVKVLPFKVK